MKKNIFLLLVLVLPTLFACHDDHFKNEQVEKDQSEISKIVLDDIAIYKIQTDKSLMINNMIRFQSGKFSLDLSKEDAEKIGISKSMYNQVIEHINQLNNSNLKKKTIMLLNL